MGSDTEKKNDKKGQPSVQPLMKARPLPQFEEFSLDQLSIGRYIKTGNEVSWKIYPRDKIIAFEVIERGLRSRMMVRNYDVSAIHIHSVEDEEDEDEETEPTSLKRKRTDSRSKKSRKNKVKATSELREVIIQMLTPVAFSHWCKDEGAKAKSNAWLPCADFTKKEALRHRDIIVRTSKENASRLQLLFNEMEDRCYDQKESDRRLPNREPYYWHALAEGAAEVGDKPAPNKRKEGDTEGYSKGNKKQKKSEEETTSSPFCYLLNDIWLTIFGLLDPTSLCNISKVNTQFYRMSSEAVFWKRHCAKFQISAPLSIVSPKKRSPSKTERDFWKVTGAAWKDSYKILSCIRCVECGKQGIKLGNHACRLLGIVLCADCKGLEKYATKPLTHALKAYKISRDDLPTLRRVTVPSLHGSYMRFFLVSDLELLAQKKQSMPVE